LTDRLLLVRHGVTDWNREGRFQGHLDARLAEDGRLEAQLLGRRLVDEAEELSIVASPLSRAAETAALVAEAYPPAQRPAVRLDPRLMEIGQGEWEGRTHAELAVEDATRYAAWRAHAGIDQPPGAETIDAALDRVVAAVADLVTESGPALCLVSHGGILRLFARQLLGVEGRLAWAMDVDNASLSVLARLPDGRGWRVERWNDTGHLLGRTSQHVDESDGEPLAL
jgi:broad specificity phosphatase PhoE